jgi:hypothetical protein
MTGIAVQREVARITETERQRNACWINTMSHCSPLSRSFIPTLRPTHHQPHRTRARPDERTPLLNLLPPCRQPGEDAGLFELMLANTIDPWRGSAVVVY